MSDPSVTPAYPPLVTASSLDRFLACPGSAKLPRINTDRSLAAQRGTEEHAQRLQRGQLPRTVLEWFGGKEPGLEVAIAADALSNDAIFLGQFLERGYPAFPTASYIGGTADAVDVYDDVLSVGDLKTGRGQARGSLSPPSVAGQLLGLAWLCRQYWRKRIGDLTWQPRRIRLMWWLTAEGRDDVWDAEIGAADLDAFATKLRRCVEHALLQSPPTLRRGPHCLHCSSFDACPTQGGAIRRLLNVPSNTTTLTPTELAEAVLSLQHARRAVESAEKAIVAAVERCGSVVVDDKHEAKLIRGSVSRIDSAVAERVLGDRFLECANVEISRAGIERAMGVAAAAEAVEAISKEGGVVTVPRSPYLRVVKRS